MLHDELLDADPRRWAAWSSAAVTSALPTGHLLASSRHVQRSKAKRWTQVDRSHLAPS